MDNPKPVHIELDPTDPVVAGVLTAALDGALRIALDELVQAKGGAGAWLDAIEQRMVEHARGIQTERMTPSKEAAAKTAIHAAEQIVKVYVQMAREKGAKT